MLQLDGLTKNYNALRAVDAVSLTVRKGEMIGIIGRSGAGKSTLLRLINRLVDPTAGSLAWEGRDVSKLSGAKLRQWRAQCAMIFQQFNLVQRVDVITNVMIGGVSRRAAWRNALGVFDDEERRQAYRLLEELDMSSRALNRADGISGGQAQRVAIARALMQHPDIILADEPVASLDPRNAKVVMDALRAINKERGLTVICNLHNLHTARNYCDRIIGMVEGKIVLECAPNELRPAMVSQVYGVASEGELDASLADVE
jgi:phosphonate transport system ATP-binding protein